MSIPLDYSTLDDRQLVEFHLAGDLPAFRQIVERHQAMICAMCVSACGDLGRSEDLAQEVFIEAWKRLARLREPEKLRGWLAGIARNLISNSFRREQRTPTTRAEPLSEEALTSAESPRDRAIGADEMELMWSMLAGIPENYREPMVLFYREQRSVPAVAAALEISEDVVRQRLVRGRAMLTERMAKLVEETLERTAPTSAFAGSVLLALPAGLGAVISAASQDESKTAAKSAAVAGGLATSISKGGLLLKGLTLFAVLPAILFGAESYLRFRARRGELETDGERKRMSRDYVMQQVAMGIAVFGMIVVPSPTFFGFKFGVGLHLLLGGVTVAAGLIFLKIKFRLERVMTPRPGLFSNETEVVREVFEFRSQASFLGWPLLHVRLWDRPSGKKAFVKGWIALSDGPAVGGLFACGTIAIAPLSLGVLSVGGFALGLFAVGGATIGGIAAGWISYGVLVAGAQAASGGLAIAAGFAKGYLPAYAPEVNSPAADAYFRDHRFFESAQMIATWVGHTFYLLWIVPLAVMTWQLAAQKLKAPRR